MNTKLSQEKVRVFSKENNLALNFRWIAVNDYIASRCCFFNSLLPQGYILAEQAIEKELKSILLLINPNENIRRLPNHQITPIIEKIHSHSELDLSFYLEFGKRLSDIYELSRYPDNKLAERIKSFGMGTDEVDLVDQMYFHLDRITLIPDEIKYRSGIHAYLCDNNPIALKTFGKWILFKNKEHEKIKEQLRVKYKEVNLQLFNKKS